MLQPYDMYLLRLLGTVTLEGPSGPLSSRVVPRRRLALLALLGSGAGGGLSRDKLVGLLWPERSDQAARHLLADTVYRVRKSLGKDSITSDGDTLHLNPTVVRVDVQEFATALSRDELEAAVELYRGPFLDGFHLPGTLREFERWVDSERLRIESAYERALESLAERAEAGGDLVQAVHRWRRLVEVDPINSRFALRLMHALAGAGDPANAIQFAHDHERLLRDELGVEPPPELTAFAERLKTAPGAEPPERSFERARMSRELPFRAERMRPPAQAMPFGFVSRDAELERLTGFLQAALAGRGNVGFVTGEAGTGKTALAAEFCRRAMEARSDLIVATGYGNAHTGVGDPYLPFTEIIGLLTGDVEARWAAGAISTNHAKRLWKLLPAAVTALLEEGRDLLGPFVTPGALLDRTSAYGGDSSWQAELTRTPKSSERSLETPPTQIALFKQYTRVLQALARRQPLLLVLDDLQWADAGSINLLFQLGRELHGSRILILGLYRPSEIALGRNGERHPLGPVVNELVRTHGDIEVRLPEEGDEDFVNAIVDALSDRLDGEFRQTLFRRTRGHPLFTVELLRHMQEQGLLTLDSQGYWTRPTDLDWEVLPARAEAVIAERINRLPRELEHILAVASVEGEVFALETVAELCDTSVDGLLSLVAEELERRHQLVRADGLQHVGEQALSQYRFRHNLFQTYLYERLDPVERAHVHARMAIALERLYGDRARTAAVPLARHYREAGVTDRAVDYLHAAGEHAMNAAALPEAVAHLRQALDLIHTLPASPERDRAELREQMTLGLMYHGVEGHGFPAAEKALERSRELAKRVGDAAQHFRISGSFWAINHMQAQHQAARDALDECLALAKQDGNPGLVALVHFWLGINSLNRGRHFETLPYLDHFRAHYDPAQHRALVFGSWGDPEHVARALRGLALWSLGHPDQAAEQVERAVRSAAEVGEPATLYTVLFYEVILRAWRYETEALSRQNDALRTVVMEQGLPQIGTLTRFYDGWCLAAESHLEKGAELMGKSLSELETQQWTLWVPYYTALLADTYRRIGRAEEGLELVDKGLLTIEKTGERLHEPEQHRIRGEVLLALDSPNPTEAEAAFRRALEIARGQEAKSYELRAATSLARLLRDQDRREEARRELETVYDWFVEGFDTADLREAKALLDELSR